MSNGYAIVTGGGSGIGRAFCLALAQRGWKIAVGDLDRDAANETVEQLAAAGGTGESHGLDVSDAVAWTAMREALQSQWPRLDLLVNNAGVLAAGQLCELAGADVRRLVDVNLFGTMWGCRAMASWLQSSGASRGRAEHRGIINVASIFASLSPPGFAAYNASKAGVVALSETLRGELRPHGLNVTVVLPGVVSTPLFGRAAYTDERYLTLMKRYADESRLSPEAVAEAALSAHRRGKLYAVMGGRARAFYRCKQLFPTRLIDLIARRTGRELEATPCST